MVLLERINPLFLTYPTIDAILHEHDILLRGVFIALELFCRTILSSISIGLFFKAILF